MGINTRTLHGGTTGGSGDESGTTYVSRCTGDTHDIDDANVDRCWVSERGDWLEEWERV